MTRPERGWFGRHAEAMVTVLTMLLLVAGAVVWTQSQQAEAGSDFDALCKAVQANGLLVGAFADSQGTANARAAALLGDTSAVAQTERGKRNLRAIASAFDDAADLARVVQLAEAELVSRECRDLGTLPTGAELRARAQRR